MRRPRGVTLAEVMIVMAIIGVLCGLMIGVLGRTYGASTKSVSEQLVSTMSLARLRATSTRRIHRVIVQSTQLSIWQATTSGCHADRLASRTCCRAIWSRSPTSTRSVASSG
jgi:prepilin-type N-terminal cleavage/methylation domain-containing protein